jgi:DNA-binding response OmpR family regulator
MGRVLVVEDDQAICALIADILADAGFETECVQSDEAAYRLLAAGPPFVLLILDINLGAGTTGYDIARAARKALPGLPVIYVSGEASDAGSAAFGVPGSVFVAKPFKRQELLDAIESRFIASV